MNRNHVELFVYYIIISMLLYIVFLICMYMELEFYDEIHVDDMLDHCNNGDLILFRWNPIDPVFRLFTKYTHIGMIVKKNNMLFVIETHPKNDAENMGVLDGGVHMHSLKDRITTYKGTCFLMKSLVHFSDKDIINSVKKYNDYPFDDYFRGIFLKNWIFDILKIKELSEKKNMYCTELINNILKDLNVTSDTLLTPSSFVDLNIYDKKNIRKIII